MCAHVRISVLRVLSAACHDFSLCSGASSGRFAEWEVDSVKVDGCNSNSSTMGMAYPRFGDMSRAGTHDQTCTTPFVFTRD